MVLDFYGLREQPFGVTPDPNYLYLSRTHGEALGALLEGIQADRGFMALIAEPGMGKTTVLYRLLEEVRDSARSVFLFQTQCDSREFFGYILSEFGIKTARMGLVSMHNKLNEVLFSEMLAGRRFVLVVDEAQDLEEPVLETIRLLSDFETPHAKLLGIILSGQPLLTEKLARPALSQLKQRIAIVRRLEALSADEASSYIEHRLKVAGYSGGQLFEPEALALIAEQTQGIPREINSLCFNALTLGEVRRSPTISGEIAREALANVSVDSIMRQLHIEGSPGPGTPVLASVLKIPSDLIFELAVEIKDAIERRAYELFEAGGLSTATTVRTG
jgi:general secretion pathway protein A